MQATIDWYFFRVFRAFRGAFLGLADDPFVFYLARRAEVDQQTESEARCFEVIVDLRSMLVRQLRNRLDFYDDLIEAQKIGLVFLFQRPALVTQQQLALGSERDSLQL
jgi:hypothetical protein